DGFTHVYGLPGTAPFEPRAQRCDARRLYSGERVARLREQVANDERGVAHHVVQHAAALELAAPEPRHMRPAVFLGGAREIRPSSCRGATRPCERASRFHVRREQLVLEVAMLQLYTFDQLQ